MDEPLTIVVMQELALGYMSGKLMLKLEAINFLLANHTRDNLPFMDQYQNMRHRTMFYLTLARLLFLEDSQAKFRTFMYPLQVGIPFLFSLVDDL